MDKILSLLTEIKAYFTGISATLDKLTAAEDRIKQLNVDLANAQQAANDGEVKIKNLNADLETAQSEVNAKGLEIKNLQASVEAEKKRANEVIAAQGLDPAQIPPASVTEPAGTSSETPWLKYQRLLATDPRAAGAFWATHSEKILQSRK